MPRKPDPVVEAHFSEAPPNMRMKYFKILRKAEHTCLSMRESNAQAKREQAQKAIAFDKTQSTLCGSKKGGFSASFVKKADDAFVNLVCADLISANTLRSAHFKRAISAAMKVGTSYKLITPETVMGDKLVSATMRIRSA
ncbi:hypothetical protein SARC_09224 [Sphaeroforma arctica JP610]|uniref:Uncharacterized protein n=1 Tax=Sphaeroforma arctica JP610 TaxID=667725 RepID=A0A0L0FNF7_9EUKA|nr:hypothetical protein SARC_09224 [Sphaeroforma arctica JP610]KNC78340.1 hypothetical protein SARC_09224 [Sphaeroforma arctica JP610]|eukprot:XP_014152242.1 hypothetical protein SARC_09224 [Sphaeroforma arctica JP610]